MTDTDRLINEAKRQRRRNPPAYLSRRDNMLWRLGWYDGWFLLKGEIARRRPFRWIWIAHCAYLLHSKWNAPKGDPLRYSRYEHFIYAVGLSELMDEGEGYLSPSEAIDIDRPYWSD